jgi:hypothetical protein
MILHKFIRFSKIWAQITSSASFLSMQWLTLQTFWQLLSFLSYFLPPTQCVVFASCFPFCQQHFPLSCELCHRCDTSVAVLCSPYCIYVTGWGALQRWSWPLTPPKGDPSSLWSSLVCFVCFLSTLKEDEVEKPQWRSPNRVVISVTAENVFIYLKCLTIQTSPIMH